MTELMERHSAHIMGGTFDDTDREQQVIEISTAAVTKVRPLRQGPDMCFAYVWLGID